MAVVSISRIQVRRGRKNQGSGLPQLASGEFGWAIDTQELYIGNGSVSEGAPYVGNTKILTENDNLIGFIGDYEYRINDTYIQTGPNIDFPVTRSILDRLDDRVSVRSFGAKGDGTDQTIELQRAIDQLYLNPIIVGDERSRVVLHLEAGEYIITDTLYIPPYASIRGAGIDKTIIRMIGNNAVFKTVSSLSTMQNYIDTVPDLSVEQQSRNVEISNLTVITDSNQGFHLSSCRDSIFQNLKIQGNWVSNDVISVNDYGFMLTATNTFVTTKNNIFNNVTIHGTSFAVYSDYDIIDNIWENCYFSTHGVAFSFGESTIQGSIGQINGPCKNIITNCTFDNIDQEAIKIANGTKNQSRGNRFYSVGNLGGDETNNVHSIIKFDTIGNISENDWFQRTELLMYTPGYMLTEYLPEIISPNIIESNYTHVLSLISILGDIPQTLFRLSAQTNTVYEIDYYYESVYNLRRSGTLTIIVDNSNQSTSSIVDDYQFNGNLGNSESLIFSVQNYKHNSSLFNTVAVEILNYTPNDEAKLYYRVKTKTNM